MKRLIYCTDAVFGMANLNPQKSGLGNVVIGSDHGGVSRKVKHNIPRIKLAAGEKTIVVSISEHPTILSRNKYVKTKSDIAEFKEGIAYIGRNYDIFLKHYNDTTFEFDDEDLFSALRERGEYR